MQWCVLSFVGLVGVDIVVRYDGVVYRQCCMLFICCVISWVLVSLFMCMARLICLVTRLVQVLLQVVLMWICRWVVVKCVSNGVMCWCLYELGRCMYRWLVGVLLCGCRFVISFSIIDFSCLQCVSSCLLCEVSVMCWVVCRNSLLLMVVLSDVIWWFSIEGVQFMFCVVCVKFKWCVVVVNVCSLCRWCGVSLND